MKRWIIITIIVVAGIELGCMAFDSIVNNFQAEYDRLNSVRQEHIEREAQ